MLNQYINLNLTRTLDLRKNEPVWKTGPQDLKALSFVSCHKKDNAEVIHYNIKNRGAQGLVQIMYEKCITDLYFENGRADIKQQLPICSSY